VSTRFRPLRPKRRDQQSSASRKCYVRVLRYVMREALMKERLELAAMRADCSKSTSCQRPSWMPSARVPVSGM